jgi:hypothetical protein
MINFKETDQTKEEGKNRERSRCCHLRNLNSLLSVSFRNGP